ncbi:hypothetical protein BpHYR1_025834 [Brachionus plicatilis]|uniref:Uncharacterized protein n=1 Tax=Brachionus plicatilis TaxID=10195 RepID=A0A3M7Q0V4_BRAPC|nr:hypothetical protein BpHYR1_025834 [Brachionus plicatilis]
MPYITQMTKAKNSSSIGRKELLMNDYQDSLERIIKSNMIVDNPSFLSHILFDDFDLDLLENTLLDILSEL